MRTAGDGLRGVAEELRVGLGDAGCLSQGWGDADAIALLEALGTDTSFVWHRDRARPDGMTLDKAILGIRVRAATPEGLMDGVEYVAAAVDSLLPRVGGHGPDDAGRAVAVKLRRHFAVRPASAPPGVEFAWDEAGETAAPAALDPTAWRDATRRPDIQEHRPCGSAIKKSLRRP